ncbi:PmoA family protein [Rhodohalobacter sp. SW132]|uniref:DUF6807 domain-containing protein n=1 Tax=Rhodohalobacter sp. SW132 TaxID=2293433 RepID=UPI0018F589CA|nr:PmoA family protein [Rhodohalobacter sp. SW132]
MNRNTNRYIHTLAIVFLLAACSQSNEDVSSEESAVNQVSMSDEYHISLVHEEDRSQIQVFIDGAHFTSYHYGNEFKKPILYPLISAGGATITRGFPIDPREGEKEDHPHQVGLWLNYGDVNGLDFWNNSNAISEERRSEYGTIHHKSINQMKSGNERGELEVTKEWVNSEGEVLLIENTTYIFSGNESMRSIDRLTNLQSSGEEVSLDDNKEGMIGIRMARELEHPDEHDEATGMYRSSEGIEGHEAWGTRAKWMSLSGEINGETVSVAILDHPDNVGYPTYWHARGYGLFAANPLGMKEMSGGEEELNFVLGAEDTLTFKHRIILYSGEETDDSVIESDWQQFIR